LTGSLRRNPSELFAAAVDISIALLHEPPGAGEEQDRIGDIVS